MAQLSVSVVIVSYYTDEVLFDCLSALIAERSDALDIEIIVVDNGNASESKKRLMILANAGQIRLATGHGNVGFGAGCNLGVALASTETLFLLNPDCTVPAGAMSQLLQFLRLQQKQCAEVVVSGWLVNTDGSEQRGLRRNTLTPWSLLLEMIPVVKHCPPFCSQRLNLTNQPTQHENLVVDACSGACMVMAKSLYEVLDGMDEQYFLHVEDLDFCRRLKDRGGHIVINQWVKLVHHQGASKASAKRIEKYKRDSFLRYFRKHHSLFWSSPCGWVLRLAIYWRYWVSSSVS